MFYMSLQHAQERIAERMGDAGYDALTISRVFDATLALAKRSTARSEAIRVLSIGRQVNEAYGERSNGDNVWAMVRGQELITMFLRRSNQPSTPEALRVEKVTII